jgi:hypothetical protein
VCQSLRYEELGLISVGLDPKAQGLEERTGADTRVLYFWNYIETRCLGSAQQEAKRDEEHRWESDQQDGFTIREGDLSFHFPLGWSER